MNLLYAIRISDEIIPNSNPKISSHVEIIALSKYEKEKIIVSGIRNREYLIFIEPKKYNYKHCN
ncbi:MAG: hypothetical protein HXX09_12715 [Bacteroidetes bacterium]|nr:hypothetical protein [Bacteroidota bacterium]